jgi:hypothetical protein
MILRNKSCLLCLAIVLIFPTMVMADWNIQLFTGSSYSFPSPLKIEQDGEEDINLTAEYETRAWSTQAPYYALRIGKWTDNHAWEFESLHQKLYLTNKPDEVQKFAISHGYNINMLNYALSKYGFIYRVGGGFVMTHPETTVRGKSWEDDGGLNGFYISGAGGQLAIEKRYIVTEKLSLSLELKMTAAYAEIPIADGTATVPNYAAHGLIGIGYDFWPYK